MCGLKRGNKFLRCLSKSLLLNQCSSCWISPSLLRSIKILVVNSLDQYYSKKGISYHMKNRRPNADERDVGAISPRYSFHLMNGSPKPQVDAHQVLRQSNEVGKFSFHFLYCSHFWQAQFKFLIHSHTKAKSKCYVNFYS